MRRSCRRMEQWRWLDEVASLRQLYTRVLRGATTVEPAQRRANNRRALRKRLAKRGVQRCGRQRAEWWRAWHRIHTRRPGRAITGASVCRSGRAGCSRCGGRGRRRDFYIRLGASWPTCTCQVRRQRGRPAACARRRHCRRQSCGHSGPASSRRSAGYRVGRRRRLRQGLLAERRGRRGGRREGRTSPGCTGRRKYRWRWWRGGRGRKRSASGTHGRIVNSACLARRGGRIGWGGG
mmetsp:Transcript_5806/g.18170  ORF Transcript_5806/g.18170 Transcript_5806/m.18170 type:complete len:236 (+) Transcript_5806:1425-2132(+)